MNVNDLTQVIVGCAYKVHNALGPGFLEKVYENSLRIASTISQQPGVDKATPEHRAFCSGEAKVSRVQT